MKRAILFTFAFFTALPLALCVPVLKAQGPTPGDRGFEDAGVGSGRCRRHRRDLGSELQEPGHHADARLAAERGAERAAARRDAAVAVHAAGPRSGAGNARTKLSLARYQSSHSGSGTNAQAHRTRGVPDLRRGGGVCAAATGGESAAIGNGATNSKMAPSATADTRKLIGRNIKNADGDTIGEIKSIYINKDGKVDSVMVGVGGFLGVGDREVRIAWSDLQDHRQRREGHGQHDQGRAQGQARVQVQERRPGAARSSPTPARGPRGRAIARGRPMRRGRRATSSPRRPSRRPTARPTSRASGRTSPPPPRPAISMPPARCRATP